ncbi:hypothetical protein D3C81_1611830 [compost metagenome]
MRGRLILVWISLSIAMHGCGSHHDINPQALRDEALSLMTSSEVNPYARAEALLDSALREDTTHVPSLLTRFALRAVRQDFAGALADVNAAITIRGRAPMLSTLRCLLRERLGADAPQACYADVLDLYRDAGIECAVTLNCVLAASMASTQDAATLRDRYLSGALSPSDLSDAEVVLRDFDRKTYLHSILP